MTAANEPQFITPLSLASAPDSLRCPRRSISGSWRQRPYSLVYPLEHSSDGLLREQLFVLPLPFFVLVAGVGRRKDADLVPAPFASNLVEVDRRAEGVMCPISDEVQGLDVNVPLEPLQIAMKD